MSDCQCQKCTWEPGTFSPAPSPIKNEAKSNLPDTHKMNEYLMPNHIAPGSAEATQQLIRVLQSEIASLRGVIDRLNAKVEKLQDQLIQMQGEQK